MMVEVFWGGRIRPTVDWAVLEVGVGGRQDPTRAIPHATTVITRIGLDHEAVLGATLSAIAREKLGAIDPENLVVHGPFPEEARGVVNQTREKLGGRWIEARPYESSVDGGARASVAIDDSLAASRAKMLDSTVPRRDDPTWNLFSPWGNVRLSLMGRRAVENTSLALATLAELGFDLPALIKFLPDIQWPCRMEKFVVRGRSVYLSGDHNPQGIESLKEILAHMSYERLFIIVGVGKNKDIGAMLASLKRMERASITLTVTPFRSSTPGELGAYQDRVDELNENPSGALDRALLQATERDVVVITGSLYLAGYFRAEFLRAEDD
jgi:dihydrofolate synthase/folylpolyglutamate synthase